MLQSCTEAEAATTSIEIGVLKKFTKFIGKHLCRSLFLNKVVGLRSATLLKKRLWHRCFSVKFVRFLKTPFFQNTSGRLLLHAEQKQPFTGVLIKRCSENMQQIYRKTPMPKCEFNKVGNLTSA